MRRRREGAKRREGKEKQENERTAWTKDEKKGEGEVRKRDRTYYRGRSGLGGGFNLFEEGKRKETGKDKNTHGDDDLSLNINGETREKRLMRKEEIKIEKRAHAMRRVKEERTEGKIQQCTY